MDCLRSHNPKVAGSNPAPATTYTNWGPKLGAKTPTPLGPGCFKNSSDERPSLRTNDVFISHAWTYDRDYYRRAVLLNAAPFFQWRNFSVPQHDPVSHEAL
jgi:hypothetical protein